MDLASVSLSDFSPAPSSPGFESGEVPPEDVGVYAEDDLTLKVKSQVPWPPMPAMGPGS